MKESRGGGSRVRGSDGVDMREKLANEVRRSMGNAGSGSRVNDGKRSREVREG